MSKAVKIKFQSEFDATAIQKSLDKITKQINEISLTDAIKKDLKSGVGEITKTLSKITSFNFDSRDTGGYTKLVETLQKQVKSVQEQINKINATNIKLETDTKEITAAKTALSGLEQQIRQLQGPSQARLNDLLDASNLPNSIKKTIGSLEDLENKIQEIEKNTSQLSTSSLIPEKSFQKYLTYLNNIKETRQEILRIEEIISENNNKTNKEKTTSAKNAGFTNYKNMKEQLSAMQRAVELYDQAEDKLKEQTAANESYIKILKNVESQFNSQKTEIKDLEKKYEDLTKKLEELQDEAKKEVFNQQADNFEKMGKAAQEAGQQMNSLDDDLRKYRNTVDQAIGLEISSQIDSFAAKWLGLDRVIDAGIRKVGEAWDTYKNIDTQVTGIAMVTGKGLEETWKEVKSYTSLARELGTTTSEIAKQSEEFYRQGLNQADTMNMIKGTTTMASIANMDFSESINYMTAAINGFKLSSDDAMMVSDIFSKLDASAAVSVEDLAIALSKTASIAKNAGMEIQTTTAFLTKMIETTQEAPENLGTAMKSVIARMQELKESPAKILEDGTDANKVETALREANVALRDTTGNFRDLDDVLLELSSKWAGLDRNTQRYIATIIAGNRQQSRFIALMDDYDRTAELVEAAYNSAGTSSVAFQKKLDNLGTAIEKVKTSFEALYLNSGLAEFFTNIVNIFAEVIQTFADFGVVNSAIIIGIGLLVIKLGTLVVAMNTAKLASENMKGSLLTFQGLIGSLTNGTLPQFIKSCLAGTKQLKTLTAAFGAFKASAGIIALVAGIVITLGAFVISATNAARKAREFNEELQELEATQTASTKEVNDLTTLYDKYEELNSIKNKTEEQNKQLYDTINEIVNIAPELLAGYDDEGNAILRNNKYVERYISLKKQEAEIDKFLYKSKQIEGSIKGYSEESKKLKEQEQIIKGNIKAYEKRNNIIKDPYSGKIYTKGAIEKTSGSGLLYSYRKWDDIIANSDQEALDAYNDYVVSQNKILDDMQRFNNETSEKLVKEQAEVASSYYVEMMRGMGENISEGEAAIFATVSANTQSAKYKEASEAGEKAKDDFLNTLVTDEDDEKKVAEKMINMVSDTYISVISEFRNIRKEYSSTISDTLEEILNGTTELNTDEIYSFTKEYASKFGGEIGKALENIGKDIEEENKKNKEKLYDLFDKDDEQMTKAIDNLSMYYTNIISNAISNIDDEEIKKELVEKLIPALNTLNDLPEDSRIQVGQLIGSTDMSDVTSVAAFKNELEGIAGIDLDSSQWTNLFAAINESIQVTSGGISQVANDLEVFRKNIKDLEGMRDRIVGGGLTAEDVGNLININPGLTAEDFEVVNGQLALTDKNYTKLIQSSVDYQIELKETEIQLIKNKIASIDLAEAQEQLELANKNYEDALKKGKDLDSFEKAREDAQNLVNTVYEGRERIKELELALKVLNSYSDISLNFNIVGDGFQKMSSALNQISDFGDIMTEQAERGQISFNNAIALIEAGYGRLINVQNGIITLNEQATQEEIKAIQERTLADIEGRQKSLQLEVSIIDTENQLSQARIDAAKQGLENIDNLNFNHAENLDKINQYNLDDFKISEQGKLIAVNESNKQLEKSTGEHFTWLVDENGKVQSEILDIVNQRISDEIDNVSVLTDSWNEYWNAVRTGSGAKIEKDLKTGPISGFYNPDDNTYNTDIVKDYTVAVDESTGAIQDNRTTIEDLKKAYKKAYDEIIKNEESLIEERTKQKDILLDQINQLEGMKTLDFGSLVEYSGELPELGKDAEETKEEVEDLTEAIGDLASIMDTLKNAYDEYNESGTISLETFQSLLDMQPGYLQYLMDENGNIALNTEALNNLIMARTQELGVQTARMRIQEAKEALEEGEIESLYNLAGAAKVASDNVWELVRAELESSKADFEAVDPSIYEGLLEQVNAIEQLTKVTMGGLGQGTVQTVEQISNEISNLTSVLTTLETAVEEFNVNGHISMQTYQDLISLQPYYLTYLMDENGQLLLNTQTIYSLIQAKTQQLAITKAQQLIDQINAAITAGNTQQLIALAGATQQATSATWGFVQAQLEASRAQLQNLMGKEQGDQLYNNYKNQILSLQRLSEAAIQGIGKETITASEAQSRLEEQQREMEEAQREAERAAEEARRKEEERQQLIDKMENALLDALIARDEKIVDNLRKKYDKMKELDKDYLNSVKKMREKEKELRESEKDLESLSKLKQRLALLERDTSGAYAKEIAELKEQIAEKEDEMKEDAKDQTIENLEEEMEKTHDRYDEDVEALEKANEAKKENMQLYWNEVNAIMDQGVDAMLETLMAYDKDFQNMSERQKANFISEMTEAANAVMGIFNDLSSSISSMNFSPNINYDGISSGGSWSGMGSWNPNKPSGGSSSGNSSNGNSNKPSGGNTSSSSGSAKFSGLIYNTYADAKAQRNGVNPVFGSGPYTILSDDGKVAKVRYYKLSSGVTGWFPSSRRYAKGGLVDYTGPAWVDGSKSKPEAFLSAMDTMLMRDFLDGLALSKSLVKNSLQFQPDEDKGGVKVYIDVKKISNDYDVERMVNIIKNELVKGGKYRNTIGVTRRK